MTGCQSTNGTRSEKGAGDGRSAGRTKLRTPGVWGRELGAPAVKRRHVSPRSRAHEPCAGRRERPEKGRLFAGKGGDGGRQVEHHGQPCHGGKEPPAAGAALITHTQHLPVLTHTTSSEGFWFAPRHLVLGGTQHFDRDVYPDT